MLAHDGLQQLFFYLIFHLMRLRVLVLFKIVDVTFILESRSIFYGVKATIA
jgi:hypothetical protein